MKREERKKIEQFFKNRPRRDELIVQKMLLSHTEERLEQKSWIKELSKIINNQLDSRPYITISWELHPEQLSKRNCHTSVVYNDKLYVLGGYDGKGIASDALIFDLIRKTWVKVPTKCPDSSANPARYAHKAALVNQEIYTFGGYVEDQGWLNDLCTISLENETEDLLTLKRLETKGETPTNRAAHSLVAIGTNLWVFGGNCNLEFYNDLYTFSLKNFTWKKVTCNNGPDESSSVPSPRAGQAMETYKNSLVVFGGGNRTEFFDDLFFFDLATCKWESKVAKGHGPSPRAGHSLVKISEKQCCIFGGGDLMNVFNDCFILDLSMLVWIHVQSANKVPTVRAGHSCGYYNNGSMIVFGGGDVWGGIYADLYVVDFSSCAQKVKSENVEITTEERIKKMKEKMEKEHSKRVTKMEALKKYLLGMEKEEEEYYVEMKKELEVLEADLTKKEKANDK